MWLKPILLESTLDHLHTHSPSRGITTPSNEAPVAVALERLFATRVLRRLERPLDVQGEQAIAAASHAIKAEKLTVQDVGFRNLKLLSKGISTMLVPV